MPALSHEERAILALESDVVAGHTVKVVAVQPAVGADALRARLAERLDATPLLRRRLAGEEWEDGAEPDLAVHVAAVDEGGSVPEVVAGLFAGRLDRSRPLWDVHVIDAGDDHSWIVWRIHHALADGTTAMRILEAALWDEHEAPAAARAAGAPVAQPHPRVPAALRHELRPSLHRSPFDGRLTGRRAVAFGAVDLHELHDGARRAVPGATLNDALLSTVAGGLRRWLEVHHDHCSTVRVKVPVSLHAAGDDAGNRDSFFCVEVPVHEPDPIARLAAIQSQTAARKQAHDAEAVDEMLSALRRASPRLARFADHAMGHPREFALNLSNVPGPRQVPAVLGAPVRSLHTLAEVGERHALRIAAISLAGVLSVGFCADPTLVDGLEPMVEGFEADAVALAAAR